MRRTLHDRLEQIHAELNQERENEANNSIVGNSNSNSEHPEDGTDNEVNSSGGHVDAGNHAMISHTMTSPPLAAYQPITRFEILAFFLLHPTLGDKETDGGDDADTKSKQQTPGKSM